MKTVRQLAILDLIREQEIKTQEEMAAALAARGLSATQATVSRDIRELRLVKVLTQDGGYKYASREDNGEDLSDRFLRMLSESVLSVASSDNLIVVKTLSGSASMAAEALDGMHWAEVLGTLAGDNTIMMVIRSDDEVSAVVDRIRCIMK